MKEKEENSEEEQLNFDVPDIIPKKYQGDDEYESKSLLARKVASVPILLLFGSYNLLQISKYKFTYRKIKWIKYLYVLPASFFCISAYQIYQAYHMIQQRQNKRIETKNQQFDMLKTKILEKNLTENEDEAQEIVDKIIERKRNPENNGRMF
mmetsp:Transcript_6788/g.5936  ORF Transcript_6788/g.5936 Transcript_6788/m.5936 type:complete len:152 (+) Transcript_6788:7-462(+)